jgi:glycosyltransferase involved in cell wall biosynthesis
VITVVFNGERYLRDTIQSVLGQTYKNIEYIIIDGGSTDATLDIIREYDDQIDYWVSESDAGIYDAMNKGVMLARGDIIGILNSDDYYELDAVDQAVIQLNQDENMIIHGAMNYFQSNDFAFRLNSEHTSRENLKRMVELHPTMFVPASIYNEVGLYDLDFPSIADWDFAIRCHRRGIKFTYLDSVLTNFRLGGESSRTTVDRAREKWRLRKTYGLKWSGLHYLGDLINLSALLILDYAGLRNWYQKYKQRKQQSSSK